MAKTESTAVNNLIALAQSNERASKPIVHPDDDLFAKPPTERQLKGPAGVPPRVPTSAAAPSRMTGNLPTMKSAGPVLPLPRTRAAGGTSQLTLPEHQLRPSTASRPSGAPLPPLPHRPTPPVLTATARISKPVFTTRLPDIELGHASDAAPASPRRPDMLDMTGDVVRAESWFESSLAVEKFDEETYVGTSPLVKHDRAHDSLGLVKKLIIPALGFIVIGAAIGGFIAFRGDKQAPAVTPAPIAAAAPALVATHANTADRPAPEAPSADVRDVQTTRGVVKLVDVRIDSKPAGATVTLVEHTASGDKRSFLGSTPISTSLEPSHQVEIEAELAGHAVLTTHLDPAMAPRASFDFESAPKPLAAAPPVVHHAAHHAAVPVQASRSTPVASLVDPFSSAPTAAPVAPAGTGTLMLSSKPPCEILVDGKPTGLSTPQRAIELAAGAHKITLLNEAARINKTVMVQINAGQPTKLVRDLIAN